MKIEVGQVRAVLKVDKDILLDVSGRENLEEAIAQELGWVQQSGLGVREWAYLGHKEDAEREGSDFQIEVCFDVDKDRLLERYLDTSLEEAIPQELSWLGISGMDVSKWEYAVPIMDLDLSGDVKKQAFAIFQKFQETRGINPNAFRIAQDMDWLQSLVEIEVDEAYCLAWKMNEASISWTQSFVHEECLEALYSLLGEGFHNAYFGVNLTPRETLDLLVCLDVDIFCAVVESQAVCNFYKYEPEGFCVTEEEFEAVCKAAQDVKHDVDRLIADSSKRVVESAVEKQEQERII